MGNWFQVTNTTPSKQHKDGDEMFKSTPDYQYTEVEGLNEYLNGQEPIDLYNWSIQRGYRSEY